MRRPLYAGRAIQSVIWIVMGEATGFLFARDLGARFWLELLGIGVGGLLGGLLWLSECEAITQERDARRVVAAAEVVDAERERVRASIAGEVGALAGDRERWESMSDSPGWCQRHPGIYLEARPEGPRLIGWDWDPLRRGERVEVAVWPLGEPF